jgi:copper homeostasis protein
MGAALEALIECGFDGVLTSGGGRDAVAGAEGLKDLVARARGRIEVIAGGGVRSGNTARLVEETGVRWVHSSAVVVGEGSGTYTGGEGGEVASEEEIGRLVEICRRLT